jgi:adenylate cyclase
LKSAFASYTAPKAKSVIASFSNSALLFESNHQIAINKSADVIVPQYSIQQLIRPLFGKGAIAAPVIGDHPDFAHLAGTDLEEYHFVATLFMDIAGSTRLGRLYPLSTVKRIKNGFMSLAIEIVQAFDGHVHRLQGDAVMAYFGRKGMCREQATIDAINAATMIRYLAEKIVEPGVLEMGIDPPPGIRLGLDYGPDDHVLWSSYGYPGVSEVTATSFYVDAAAKLQGSAGKNQLMIGQSIRDFLDLPEDLIVQKLETRDGQKQMVPYLQPNHTDRSGKPFNYRQFVFDCDSFIRTTSIAQADDDFIAGNHSSGPLRVTAEVFAFQGASIGREYRPSSGPVSKGEHIKFRIQLPYEPRLPYTVQFVVENHGMEAKAEGGPECDNHQTTIQVRTHYEHQNLYHWESAAYRGLHYMTVRVSTAAGLQHETKFGVFVK